MCARSALAFTIVKEPLVYQSVAYGGNGYAGADIVGKEQDDLAQKRGVCDLFLPPAFFTFQNITDDYRGIDTVKKRQCFFLIQTDIGDSRHSAESYIGIKYLTQFIMFPVFVEYLFAESPERTLYFMYFKAVKIKKFME